MSQLGQLLSRINEALEKFNDWVLGDLEASLESLRGDRIVVFIKQVCACSLDFSIKEELEAAFRDAGIRVEIDRVDFDASRVGYVAYGRILGVEQGG